MALYPRSRMVLTHLATEPGPVSKWSIIDNLWPGANDDDALCTEISRLRAALGRDAILTIRNVGYQLTEKGRAAYALMTA